MTAVYEPGHLFTVREFMELEYDPEVVRYELQEGNLVVRSRPRPWHAYAVVELVSQLRPHLPAGYLVLVDADVNLELAPEDKPGTVRVPDLFVVHEDEYHRCHRDDDLLRASGVLLAVEILSPSTQRVDRVIKFSEYADANIAHYWMVDLEPPISLRAYHLAGPFGYRESEEATGTYTTNEPFPVTIDLAALARKR